ncbi:MAG: DoxX family membrane protein [Anaerolineae bacterium]|nr:DoxX family membrane protein [Anaerolineae bacterium]
MSEIALDLAILILRLSLGVIMVSHGIPKIVKREVLGKKWNDHYGVPKATIWLTGILQIVGGLALIVGIFTSLTSLVLALDMLAALYICIFNSHHREPFNSVSPVKGWDVNLLLVAALVVLVLVGGGKWSLDAALSLSPWLI